MESGIIYTITSALLTVGFYEFIKWLYLRKGIKKKHDIETSGVKVDIYERMLNKTEARGDQTQKKLDAMFAENYELKNKVLDLTETIGKIRVELEVLRVQKCEEHGCSKRVPPSTY